MIRRWLILILVALMAKSTVSNTAPADIGNEDLLAALWQSPWESAAFFAESFLAEVPASAVKGIIEDLTKRCGAIESVEPLAEQNHFRIRTARCDVPTQLHRDGSGKIIGLLFQTPSRRGVALADLLEEVASFDGDVSYAVYRNGELVAGHDSDRPLAVGSAFKLLVLAALHDMIERGEAEWADVVTLETRHISLPSGRLQLMPIGSPLTLHTLAALMIAESDNTATDVLIDVVGRSRLEENSGLRPFLTTREFFLLKADEDTYQRYARSDLEGRRDVLRSLEQQALPRAEQVAGLWQHHAEWLLSTSSLCAWIEKVAHLELTQINPGILDKADWQRIAYKGGSEGGVLNLTTSALDDRDNSYCVSMTWNAERPLDETSLGELHASIFAALARD